MRVASDRWLVIRNTMHRRAVIFEWILTEMRAELRSLRNGLLKPFVITAAYATLILIILPVFALYGLREAGRT